MLLILPVHDPIGEPTWPPNAVQTCSPGTAQHRDIYCPHQVRAYAGIRAHVGSRGR